MKIFLGCPKEGTELNDWEGYLKVATAYSWSDQDVDFSRNQGMGREKYRQEATQKESNTKGKLQSDCVA